MQFGRFRLGMRTIKSALAVFLCILFFHLTQRGIPMIAALSAVFSLRQDLTTTVSFITFAADSASGHSPRTTATPGISPVTNGTPSDLIICSVI